MNILIGCEFSGIVRDAFIAKGHNAVSCDVLPSERPGPHIQDDIRKHLRDGWDMLIAFPPCTYLARSGGRWFKEREPEQEAALKFVRVLFNAPIRLVAVENPVGVISTRIARPSQYIHPWQHGHPEEKKTCLWLFDLPYLKPTEIVTPTYNRVHRMRTRSWRWIERSRTLTGIATAMAEQWGEG